MSSMSMSIPREDKGTRVPHHSGSKGSVQRPSDASYEGHSAGSGPSLRDFLRQTFLPIIAVPEDSRLGITDSDYRLLHERCCRWCRQSNAPEPQLYDDPEEGLSYLYSYISGMSKQMVEVLFFDEDKSWHMIEKAYVTNENKLFLVSLRPTFEKMSPEAGSLVRGFLKSMFYSSDGIYGLDLMEYVKGYLECDIEENWRGMDDEDLENQRKMFNDYFVDGYIHDRLDEYRNSSAVTRETVMSFVPKTDSEKALKELLLQGCGYIGELYSFICRNSDMQGVYCDEYCDAEFIPIEYLYGVAWDNDDDMSSECLDHLNMWSQNGAEPSVLCAFGEIGFGEPLEVKNSPSAAFQNYFNKLIDFIDEYN